MCLCSFSAAGGDCVHHFILLLKSFSVFISRSAQDCIDFYINQNALLLEVH